MHKIRSSLTEHDRPRTSMASFFPRENSLREFVPFTKQRDSMGRLIRPTSHLLQHPKITNFNQKQIEGKEISPVTNSKMEVKMSKYFKQTVLFNISDQLSKNKVIKKKSLINIVFTDFKALKNESKAENQNSRLKSPLKGNTIPFIQKEWSEMKPATEQGFRRANSSLLTRCQSSMTKPIRKSEEITFKGRQSFTHKEEELNLEQYQQLNLYHKRQKLQIKMQTTFEEGHLKFIDKMKKSKQLAFDLKCNLDQIDNYC